MKRFSSYLLAFAACASFSAAGCSTVIKTAEPDEVAAAAEREALRAAAAAVAWAPWPKPSSSTLADRLAGTSGADETVSREDAVSAYVALLRLAPSARASLLADAARHLDAAQALTTVAREACETPTARLSDVALVEAAIADLRETRAIYKAAFKKIDAGEDDGDRLAHAFDDAIKDLGEAADDLARSAMKKHEDALARSTPVASAASS